MVGGGDAPASFMSSSFNILYLGEARAAAAELDETGARSTNEELSAALINALRRIDRLETQVQELRCHTSNRKTGRK